MDPVTLLAIGIGTSVAGTMLSAGGQIAAGQAQKEGYKYNAKVAEAEARAKKVSSVYEEEQSRKKLKMILGTQKALYAKAGVDITSGSPLLTLIDTAMEGEKEARMIRYGGEVESAQSINEARLNKMYAGMAGRAGIIGGLSTFFTGLGQAGLGYAGVRKGIV